MKIPSWGKDETLLRSSKIGDTLFQGTTWGSGSFLEVVKAVF